MKFIEINYLSKGDVLTGFDFDNKSKTDLINFDFISSISELKKFKCCLEY